MRNAKHYTNGSRATISRGPTIGLVGRPTSACGLELRSSTQACTEDCVSYQAESYVCKLRGVSRGEKCVLWVVAHYLDQRTGIARIAQDNIGADAEMSERHVRRLT